MAGKTKASVYSEFRNVVEWRRHGKYRLQADVMPAFAAYLLMYARQYERQREAMMRSSGGLAVPGAEGFLKACDQSIATISLLLNNVAQNFSALYWEEAAAEVRRLMGITSTTPPIQAIPEEQFAPLMRLPDGSEQPGSGNGLHPCVGAGPEPGDAPRNEREPSGPERGRKRGVAKTPKHAGGGVRGRKNGRAPGDSGA